MSKILCIAVHPDDETIGAGGSLLKWKSEGHEIHWLIMTSIKDHPIFPKEKFEKRQKEIEKIKALFGFATVTQLDFHSVKLDEYPMGSIVQKVSEVVSSVKPETLILPHQYDAHSDHRVTFDACRPLLKTFRYPFIKKVLSMEVISETDYALTASHETFLPNYFVDISTTIQKKIILTHEYQGEFSKHPFPRSETGLLALAQLRGAMCGAEAAEAFQILKIVE